MTGIDEVGAIRWCQEHRATVEFREGEVRVAIDRKNGGASTQPTFVAAMKVEALEKS